MTHRSNSTQLHDRILYYDGDSELTPEGVLKLLQRGHVPKNTCVNELTTEIKEYNRLVSEDRKIKVKEHVRELSKDWTIPQEYLDLDVIDYVYDKFFEEISDNLSLKESGHYTLRLAEEFLIYEDLGLMPVLKCVIFLINTLENKEIVWGIGRGSAVSSYVLYVIGLHDVDSVKYKLPFDDFISIPTGE